jgi:hypothetical protein
MNEQERKDWIVGGVMMLAGVIVYIYAGDIARLIFVS